MSDGQLRHNSSLPTPTGRNQGATRFNTATDEPVVSDGTQWLQLAGGFTASFHQPDSLTLTNQVFFVAPVACKVVAALGGHGSSSGSASGSFEVTKDSGTDTPGAGDSIHEGADAFATTPATKDVSQTATLSATEANLTLAAGDRLSILVNSQNFVDGAFVTVWLKPLAS